MTDFGIRSGYTERAAPIYALDAEISGFQPHVYDLARTFARASGSRRIVDIGCGKASKLVALASEFEIVGLDTGENLQYPAGRYPFGRWINVDLETVTPGVVDVANSVVICADVIEHLQNPSALVVALCFWMRDAVVGLLSTPERTLCYGADHAGPPPNPAHVREWTRVELVDYLTQSGLTVGFSGLTQTHIDHPETGAHQGCQTTVVVLERAPQPESRKVL